MSYLRTMDTSVSISNLGAYECVIVINEIRMNMADDLGLWLREST